jgi:sodium/bile acid cotransporter 7
MKSFLIRQWFLVALAAVLVVGFSASDALSGFANDFPVKVQVAAVLFLMSWTLNASAIWRAVRYPGAAILGIAVNFLVLPLLAWAAKYSLIAPLDDGLVLAAAVPCTMASAAVWTRRAGGNDAVAMVVTMVTNISCFVVTPLLLWLLTARGTSGQFNLKERIVELFIVCVLPMIAGQVMRLPKPLGRWATDHKVALSTVAQCGILTMVLVGATKSSQSIADSTAGVAPSSAQWITMLAAVAAIHLAALFVGFALGRIFGLSRENWIAVGIAGSQKTLMIGIQIAIAEQWGIGLLPMVAYHATQLLIDTIVADRLSRRPPD